MAAQDEACEWGEATAAERAAEARDGAGGPVGRLRDDEDATVAAHDAGHGDDDTAWWAAAERGWIAGWIAAGAVEDDDGTLRWPAGESDADDDWHPTHRITFCPRGGEPQVCEVALADSGAAYTREEWDAEDMADWECGPGGEWTCCGQATPGGRPGTVEVEDLDAEAAIDDAVSARVAADDAEEAEVAARVEREREEADE